MIKKEVQGALKNLNLKDFGDNNMLNYSQYASKPLYKKVNGK